MMSPDLLGTCVHIYKHVYIHITYAHRGGREEGEGGRGLREVRKIETNRKKIA